MLRRKMKFTMTDQLKWSLNKCVRTQAHSNSRMLTTMQGEGPLVMMFLSFS